MVTLEKPRALYTHTHTHNKSLIHPSKTKINFCYIKIQLATHKNTVGEGCIGERWMFNRERPTECVNEVC